MRKPKIVMTIVQNKVYIEQFVDDFNQSLHQGSISHTKEQTCSWVGWGGGRLAMRWRTTHE